MQEVLYNQYSSRMMAVCMRYAHTRFEAEDIFHEAFVKVFQNIDKYTGTGSFEGWMRHLFVNTAINHYHKHKKHNHHAELDHVPETASLEADAFAKLSNEDLMGLINKLPTGYKLVLNLFIVEGFNHKEIAEKLNIAEGTSKSQLAKAKAMLQKQIIQLNAIKYVER